MNENQKTKDTAETVSVPALPADDRMGEGYDWMNILNGTPWSVLSGWSTDGWDAGAWPYIIFTTATHEDENGPLYGYGLYVEGDTFAHWYRDEDACHKAITAQVFFSWKSGQSDGPNNLPETAEELGEEYTKPYGTNSPTTDSDAPF